MPTDSPTTQSSAERSLASDDRWSWSSLEEDGDPRWELRWSTDVEARRHSGFVEEYGDKLFPYAVVSQGETSCTLRAGDARPFSTIQWRKTGDSSIVALFESLGMWLRSVHELDAPAGFGDVIVDDKYHTFNAFMATEFTALSRRMQELNNEMVRDTAVETMATLRHELSAFHPHGRSTWTVGRPTPERLATGENPSRVECFLDFGAVALRPPEYDLAALRVHGLLPEHPIAERAFWKGYKAAVTCDLSRRLAYFESLIELERLLGCPAYLTGDRST